MRVICLGIAATLGSTALVAQESAPLPVAIQDQTEMARLPANTEVLLRMNQEVTTKGKRWNEGDTFNMTVVHDVRYGEYIVIPRGSRGVGKITWLTNKGAFGKSGKMDIELLYVEVAGQRINLEGTYRQEGEGNTVATVGGVLVAGLFAGFITGKSGRIPQGRELMATTENDVVLAIPASESSQSIAAGLAVSNETTESALPVAPVQRQIPDQTATPESDQPVTSSRLKKGSAIRCVTC